MNDDIYNDPLLDQKDIKEVLEDVAERPAANEESSELLEDLETVESEIEDLESLDADESIDDVEFVETDGEGDEKKDRAKLKQLREELKKSQTESRDHLTALQRSRADYVNLKKELDETRDVTKKKTTERVVMDFLPVLDSFDMAMGNTAAWEAVDKNWRVGVEYIYGQFQAALGNHGIEAIDKSGQNVPFDPTLHEPMETKETDNATLDDTVERIIQKGYKMGDRVVRPARVVVWKLR
jgi:molecular chaperone GrpE